MKKTAIIILVGVLLAGSGISLYAFSNHNNNDAVSATTTDETKGIKFIEDDWAKALKQAKDEKKLVFLDIYASWCGPCKMLKKNTFTNEKAGEFFNKNFVNVSIDGEKGVGPELARKYNIEGYPSLIVTDADGNIVLFTMGYVDANYLLTFGQEALKRKS